MNIVVKSALAGAALAVAHACANPVDISGDVLPVDPSAFGDGGVLLGGAAGSTSLGGAAQGGTSAGTGGTSSAAAGSGGTGSAIAGSGGTGMQVGLSGAGGVPVGVGGSVGAGTGGTAQGGTGAGTGGSAGTGGAAAGTGGVAGTGSEVGIDPANCLFDSITGCEDLTCEAACAANDTYCLTRCPEIIACVSSTPTCITTEDPLCGVRVGQMQTENACTVEVQQSGGPNPSAPTGNAAPQPSFVARQFVECICSVPRP